jgi:hypothetical protein
VNTSEESAPLLRVISKDATPEEIAALVAVLSSLGGQPAPKKPAPVWAANTRKMRETLRRGPGAWRASGLPH